MNNNNYEENKILGWNASILEAPIINLKALIDLNYLRYYVLVI